MKLFVFVIFIFSIVIHEVAHAYAALLFGDTTARDEGRITFNPIPHIDLMWSIIIPLMTFFSSGGGVIFGGAKPVPVNQMRFYDRRLGMSLVSAAGPMSNFTLAFIAAAILNTLINFGVFSSVIIEILQSTVIINLVLAIFNLIPIPPLDGSKLLIYFLPPEYEYSLHRFEIVGFFLLIFLVWTHSFNLILEKIMLPLARLII